MNRGAWQATVHGLQRVGHDLAIFIFFFLYFRNAQNPSSMPSPPSVMLKFTCHIHIAV